MAYGYERDTTATGATKHICGGPAWGRLTDGCPRCEELKAGAPRRELSDNHKWAIENNRRNRAADEAARQHHFGPDGPHARGDCRPCCTFMDW